MNYLHALRESVTPILKKSKFSEGVLTPEEFVAAGDFLVYKCPTWSWSSGEPGKRRSYLPKDKQYLVTKYVPCVSRCADAENLPETQVGEWTVFEDPNTDKKNEAIRDISEDESDDGVDKNVEETAPVASDSENESEDDEDDGDDFLNIECPPDDDDEGVDLAAMDEKDTILFTRTYDVYITYDKYYRTPRVWLYGYDEGRNPLNQEQLFEDVSPDHAYETVTYEYHPHENYMAMSIHPCKHASVMRKLIARSNTTIVRADQYLCLFLKFIGSVIPTITYDFSISM